VGQGVRVGHLDNRKFLAAFEVALWPFGMAPVCSFYIRPPLEMVVERYGMVGWRKNDGTGDQILGRSTGKLLRGRLPFRDSHVTGCLNEPGKLLVGHIGLIHPEAIHIHPVEGACIVRSVHGHLISGGWIHCAHRKLTAGNPCHPLWWRRANCNGVGNGGGESSKLSSLDHGLARFHAAGGRRMRHAKHDCRNRDYSSQGEQHPYRVSQRRTCRCGACVACLLSLHATFRPERKGVTLRYATSPAA